MTSDSCQSRKDRLSWWLKIHIFLEWQSANRRLFSNPSLTRSLLGPPHHGRRPRHRPARQDLRLLDLLRWAELFSLPYHFFVSFRLRPHHVLLKEKKKKRSTASRLFLLRLCGGRGTSLPITASQGRALTPPSICMDTKCANEELRRRRVMLKCFCPLAAIINITVVIDVYLQLANEDSNVHTCFKKHVSDLTYFILSALHLTCKSTMHFEITVCMLFICRASVCTGVSVFTEINVRTWNLSSLSVAF